MVVSRHHRKVMSNRCYFLYNFKVLKSVLVNAQLCDWCMLIHAPVTWTNNCQPLFWFLLYIHRWNWWLPQAHYWKISICQKKRSINLLKNVSCFSHISNKASGKQPIKDLMSQMFIVYFSLKYVTQSGSIIT